MPGDDLDRELNDHVDLEADELRGRGVPPGDARHAARRTLGNRTAIKEAVYEMSPLRLLDAAARDFRQALRQIRLNPRYAIALIAILAVCLGANMAVFSVVNSVLLRPLPVPEADRIVLMGNRYPNAGAGETGWSAAGDYYDRLRGVSALERQAMFRYVFQIMESGLAAERISGMTVTPSLFRLLRVSPALGRAFDDKEGEPGAAPTVILSHGLWRSHFASDPAIVGREIRMGGRTFTVIGVMPEGFLFYDPDVRFWTPLVFDPAIRNLRHSNNWWNIGRLRPGATVEQAQAQVNAINAANLERAGDLRELLIRAGFETRVEPLKDFMTRGAKGSLQLLWAAALLVLTIGALNAAGLVAARTVARRREMGMRLALGSGFGRLASQIAMENIVLAFAGGAAGLALAYGLVPSLARFGLDRFPRAAEVRMDAAVAAFGVAGAIAAGLAIAAISILHISRLRVASALADFSRSASAGRRVGVARRTLVTLQVALAFVLLMGSGLLLASFRELLRAEPGFATEGVLTATTLAPSSRYAGRVELHSLMSRSLDAVRAIPGVVVAGASSAIPLQTAYMDSVIFPEGYVPREGESVVSPIGAEASSGYFDAMGIRLLAGRSFDERDTDSSNPVVIVDRRLAGRFWPEQTAVGRRVFFPSPETRGWRANANTRWFTVVGVVENTRMKNLAGTGNEAGVYYIAASQSPPRTFTIAIKTPGDPETLAAPLRAVMRGVDPLLALFDVQSMAQRAAASLASRRAALTLSLAFGIISLLLASIGLYGVLSYLYAQRRREIAVRMAVGCTPWQAFLLLMREGALLTAAGLGLGAIAAFAGRGIAERFVYGVEPFEPAVAALAVLTLAAVASLATALPALRAARLDPAAALSEQ